MAKNKTVNMVANIVKMFNTKCKSSIELTSKSANLSNIADHWETQNFTDFKNVKKLQVTSPSFVKNKPRDYHIKKGKINAVIWIRGKEAFTQQD